MKKKILCLAMLALMVLGTPITALANSGASEPAVKEPDWRVTFTGSQIKSDLKGDDLQNLLSNAQPGDEVEVVVELKNDSKNMTDWYMANDIATKMEKSTAESGGAYTYILRYIDSDGNGTELYNSKTVDVAANDSFAAAQKNGFYLDRLGAGEKASVSLYMKLDGETVNNDYQGGNIEMNLDFTVEEITSNTIKKEVTKIKEETVITYEPPVVVAAKGASTGDSAPVMVFSMIAFASAAALAVIAIKMMKKNRKEEGVQ